MKASATSAMRLSSLRLLADPGQARGAGFRNASASISCVRSWQSNRDGTTRWRWRDHAREPRCPLGECER